MRSSSRWPCATTPSSSADCGRETSRSSPAFDAAGVGAAIGSGLDALTPRGKVVVVGIHEKAMEFNLTSLLLGETSVVGSIVYLDEDYTEVIQAMADGHYVTEGGVSHHTRDGLLDAYTDLRAGRQMNILIDL